MRAGCKRTISLGRHKTNCKVCAHEQREEIEARFVGWQSPATIAREYKLADRSSIYRHAHALGLLEKRKRNVQAALECIIERANEVEVTAPAVVAAVQAYAKINARGQWIDRTEHVNLNDWFERMTQDELEAYAREGKLPTWFTQTAVATLMDSQEVKNGK
jgi:hypothetical protein